MKFPDFVSVKAKDFVTCCLQKAPFNRKNVKNLLKHPFVYQQTLINEVDYKDDIFEQCQNNMRTSPFIKNKQFFEPVSQEEVIVIDKVASKEELDNLKASFTSIKKVKKKNLIKAKIDDKEQLRKKRMSLVDKPVKQSTNDVKKSKSINPVKSPVQRQTWKDQEPLIHFKRSKMNFEIKRSSLSSLPKQGKEIHKPVKKERAKEEKPVFDSDDSNMDGLI